jgi:putative oxidoreductase
MVHITAPADVKNISLLLIRVVVGISFLVSARNKNRDIRKFAKNNGLPMPAAVVVMCVEFISAVALVLGILAQYAAIAIMLLMLGTMRLHIFKWKSSYWASQGGWEYDLMLFTFVLAVLAFGAGSWVLAR